MLDRLDAALNRLPSGSVFAGRTAAWLYGLDVAPDHPIEVIVPDHWSASARVRFFVRRSSLDGDVCSCRGYPVTSPARTLADLCRRRSLAEAVVFTDMALNRRLLEVDELHRWISERRGWHGIKAFRRVAEYADAGAESPMETRIRVLLVGRRLPRPVTQFPIFDPQGFEIARIDLFYPDCRLGIEYDGEGHRDRMVEDLRRQNFLLVQDIQLLRYTGADYYGRPGGIVAEVRAEHRRRLRLLDPKAAPRGTRRALLDPKPGVSP